MSVGIHEISVLNPEQLECVSEESVQVEIIPPPQALSLSEEMTCLEEGSREITVTGEGFLTTQNDVPTVSVGSYSIDAHDLDNCIELTGPQSGQLCQTLRFTLAEDAEITGIHNVVVTNPNTAVCYSEETQHIELLGTPEILSLNTDIECIDQSDQEMTLTGENFVFLADGTPPTIVMGDVKFLAYSESNCTELTGPQMGKVCTEVKITLPEDAQSRGVYDISVKNFEQTCSSINDPQYETISRPKLISVSKTQDCIEQGDQNYILKDLHFM